MASQFGIHRLSRMALAFRLVAIAAVSLTVLPLAGCFMIEDTARAPFPIQLQQDGSIRVASCTTGKAVKLEIVRRPEQGHGERETILKIDDLDLDLVIDQDLSDAARDAGSVVADSIAGVAPGNELLDSVTGVDGKNANAAYVVPEDGLPTDSWLQPDESLTSTPCSSDTEAPE
jgi:hypothetical protein